MQNTVLSAEYSAECRIQCRVQGALHLSVTVRRSLSEERERERRGREEGGRGREEASRRVRVATVEEPTSTLGATWW